MSEVTRTRIGTETLQLKPCPVCSGDIYVWDCGYASFNPGWAKCRKCQRQWDMGYVNDEWGAGVNWNRKTVQITEDLAAFGMIKIVSKRSATAVTAKRAKQLYDDLRQRVIGAYTPKCEE